MLLTSSQVTEARFPSSTEQEGYDMPSVDAFLKRIAHSLRAWELGSQKASPASVLSAQEVNAVAFPVTSPGQDEGYLVEDLDGFLDEVVRTLEHYEARATATFTASTKARPLSSQEVGGLVFTTVNMREGYDRDQVDVLRDKITATLHARENGTWVGGPYGMLTSTDVRKIGFQRTMFQTGYAPHEVDAFLDDVARSLAAYESGLVPQGAKAQLASF